MTVEYVIMLLLALACFGIGWVVVRAAEEDERWSQIWNEKERVRKLQGRKKWEKEN